MSGPHPEKDEGIHTAHDIKTVHRRLEGYTDDELKGTPILNRGTRLEQGATYIDLRDDQPLSQTLGPNDHWRSIVNGSMKVETDQSIIAGRYRLESRTAAQTAHGPVELWDAYDLHLDRPVCVRILSEQASIDPDESGVFLEQQRALSSLCSPAILAVYDFDTWQGRPFSVIQQAIGEPASALKRPGATSNMDIALRVTRQVAEALQERRTAGLVNWGFSPEGVTVDEGGNAHFALLDNQGAQDLADLARLLRLILTGRPDAEAQNPQGASEASVATKLLERLETGHDDNMASPGDVAREIAAIEEASAQLTQANATATGSLYAYHPPIGAPTTMPDAVQPLPADPSDAPTLVAQVVPFTASTAQNNRDMELVAQPWPLATPAIETTAFSQVQSQEYAPLAYADHNATDRGKPQSPRWWLLLPVAGLLLLLAGFVVSRLATPATPESSSWLAGLTITPQPSTIATGVPAQMTVELAESAPTVRPEPPRQPVSKPPVTKPKPKKPSGDEHDKSDDERGKPGGDD